MIKCNNLIKNYKLGDTEISVLRGVSFEIQKGEFVSIIGPSGSGKTTLMNIMGALDRPSSGEYFLDNKNVFAMSDDDLAEIRSEKIGFVFQSFNLLPRATVLRSVIMPLLYDKRTARADRYEKAAKALKDAGLDEDRWHHLSNQLSGGQMQRVAIARALINNPGIILADEPTGNLDSKTGRIVLETFQRLNREEGHTLILITHDQHVADFANRVIEIQDGLITSDKKIH